MPTVTTKTAVSLAVLLAVALAAATLAVLGFTAPAAAAAARNTARFSGLLFALALAWPALGGAARRFAATSALLCAFVAAHAVHYAAVLNLAVLDSSHHLHQLQPGALGVAAFGAVLLLAIALTIGAPQGWKQLVHRATLGIAWLLFAIAFGSGARERALDLAMLVLVLVALGRRAHAAFANRAPAVSLAP